MKIDLKPHQARATSKCRKAWWYENARSIDIYVAIEDGVDASVVRIPRAQLADYIKRTGKP